VDSAIHYKGKKMAHWLVRIGYKRAHKRGNTHLVICSERPTGEDIQQMVGDSWDRKIIDIKLLTPVYLAKQTKTKFSNLL
jgi:hypothetical protein